MPADDWQGITGIDHVQITIPIGREPEARAFYIEFLGLTEIPKPTALQGRGGFWLDGGNLALHVGVEPAWDRGQTRAHVAFAVADISVWRERVADAGYPLIDPVPIPGRDRFEATDPFGNRIEFIGPSAR
jgi:catechol 2,3-dioxygenase-like lactoylglutathione lyase family enzyme